MTSTTASSSSIHKRTPSSGNTATPGRVVLRTGYLNIPDGVDLVPPYSFAAGHRVALSTLAGQLMKRAFAALVATVAGLVMLLDFKTHPTTSIGPATNRATCIKPACAAVRSAGQRRPAQRAVERPDL